MALTALLPQAERAFAADVRAGLMRSPQKELSSRYLYDTIGSGLFEVITALPEYGVTRAEERIVRSHAAEMVSRLPAHGLVAELGSGSGRKTRWLLEAIGRRHPVTYCPVDISPTAPFRFLKSLTCWGIRSLRHSTAPSNAGTEALPRNSDSLICCGASCNFSADVKRVRARNWAKSLIPIDLCFIQLCG